MPKTPTTQKNNPRRGRSSRRQAFLDHRYCPWRVDHITALNGCIPFTKATVHFDGHPRGKPLHTGMLFDFLRFLDLFADLRPHRGLCFVRIVWRERSASWCCRASDLRISRHNSQFMLQTPTIQKDNPGRGRSFRKSLAGLSPLPLDCYSTFPTTLPPPPPSLSCTKPSNPFVRLFVLVPTLHTSQMVRDTLKRPAHNSLSDGDDSSEDELPEVVEDADDDEVHQDNYTINSEAESDIEQELEPPKSKTSRKQKRSSKSSSRAKKG
jgi:hypothetical protein